MPDGSLLIVSMIGRRVLRLGADGSLDEYADLAQWALMTASLTHALALCGHWPGAGVQCRIPADGLRPVRCLGSAGGACSGLCANSEAETR
jgi:hypothetical protein